MNRTDGLPRWEFGVLNGGRVSAPFGRGFCAHDSLATRMWIDGCFQRKVYRVSLGVEHQDGSEMRSERRGNKPVS